ncbi:exo-alpha-sialidase [Verrucomicrobiales bacterium BCK34]|nr:exo-alpha-sialidase [Verrucomicrobiales bacterium BCK34]
MKSQSNHSTNRRHFLKTAGAATAGVIASAPGASRAGDGATVLETKVISQQSEYYHGWSTLARRKNGELWLTWSGGRVAHVCPFGQVHAMTSKDDGRTWTWPRVLLDGAIDDRDSGVLETAKGTLIATTFTSLAYEPYIEKGKRMSELGEGGWQTKDFGEKELKQWMACNDRLTPEERKAELGVWAIRSEDGGKTWGGRLPTVVNSPHGPTQLKDGRLLYAGKMLWSEGKKIGVCESKDDGKTWQWLADIPAREGDNPETQYHELHAVEAADGTIIAQIRNHSAENKSWTLQTESSDGGKTWSIPHPITFGLPSHLLKLRDDRLLMTYGHRRAPFGNQARISSDNGKTWGEPMIISGDGAGGDLGYPSTVELDDGSLLTVWYEKMKGSSLAVLRQAHWKISGGA